MRLDPAGKELKTLYSHKYLSVHFKNNAKFTVAKMSLAVKDLVPCFRY